MGILKSTGHTILIPIVQTIISHPQNSNFMAKSSSQDKSFEYDGFIKHLVPDPGNPPEVNYFKAYIGPSINPEEEVCLYLDSSLKNSIRVARNDIVHWQKLSPEESSLGGYHVWVRAGANYAYQKPGSKEESKAQFFEGELYNAYLKYDTQAAAGGMVPQQPGVPAGPVQGQDFVARTFIPVCHSFHPPICPPPTNCRTRNFWDCQPTAFSPTIPLTVVPCCPIITARPNCIVPTQPIACDLQQQPVLNAQAGYHGAQAAAANPAFAGNPGIFAGGAQVQTLDPSTLWGPVCPSVDICPSIHIVCEHTTLPPTKPQTFNLDCRTMNVKECPPPISRDPRRFCGPTATPANCVLQADTTWFGQRNQVQFQPVGAATVFDPNNPIIVHQSINGNCPTITPNICKSVHFPCPDPTTTPATICQQGPNELAARGPLTQFCGPVTQPIRTLRCPDTWFCPIQTLQPQCDIRTLRCPSLAGGCPTTYQNPWEIYAGNPYGQGYNQYGNYVRGF